VAEAVARRHVVLVGLPGSGKTTVGRLAAERLGAPFSDLDEAIAARAGKSVARIFAEDGPFVVSVKTEKGRAEGTLDRDVVGYTRRFMRALAALPSPPALR